MTVLCTADLHLTTHPKCEYRWDLLPWLSERARKHQARQVLLLGDITDAKDRHPSILVNRLVKALTELASVTEVVVLQGNHDAIDPQQPFFGFLRHIPCLTFVNQPIEKKVEGEAALFLPATKNWQSDWQGFDWRKYAYIFTHQTYDGALSENGTGLRGVPPGIFAKTKAQVVSGDIHVPQRVNANITYVGAPYRVHFGDSFTPRVLLLRNHETRDLHFPTITREALVIRKLDDLEAAEFAAGTQIRVRVQLRRAEFSEWPKLRRAVAHLAHKRGWDLCGCELVPIRLRARDADEDAVAASPEVILKDFISRKKLDKATANAGLQFLKASK